VGSEPWLQFDRGATLGKSGSEEGTIVLDEEHPLGARITLERETKIAPYAITCGVYGWMVHTRFLGSEAEARGEVREMKLALAEILEQIPNKTAPTADAGVRVVTKAIGAFVERFP
jgi:hypothetical protein